MDDMSGLQGMMQIMSQFSSIMPQKKTDNTQQLKDILNKYYQMGIKRGKISVYENILYKISIGTTIDDIKVLCEAIKEMEDSGGEL